MDSIAEILGLPREMSHSVRHDNSRAADLASTLVMGYLEFQIFGLQFMYQEIIRLSCCID